MGILNSICGVYGDQAKFKISKVCQHSFEFRTNLKDGVEAPLDRGRGGVDVGGGAVGGRPVPEWKDGAAAGPEATVHGREARTCTPYGL